jgi:F-type H+-transporting ATPase subunit epsilon
MAQTFKGKILTPSAVVFEGEIKKFFTKTSEGELEFLSNHAPMIVGTVSCITVLEDINGTKYEFFTSKGIINVLNNTLVLCCDQAETEEEIDLERAQEAKKRAEERLKNPEKYDMERATEAFIKAELRTMLKKQSK